MDLHFRLVPLSYINLNKLLALIEVVISFKSIKYIKHKSNNYLSFICIYDIYFQTLVFVVVVLSSSLLSQKFLSSWLPLSGILAPSRLMIPSVLAAESDAFRLEYFSFKFLPAYYFESL